ncbi:MAG: hypothetical protein V3W22_07190 [Thermoplasmata archaeon]
MKKEELLKQLEERLARGEIGEETYKEIKARYHEMPEEPVAEKETPAPADTETATEGDISAMVQETIEAALEEVGQRLETTFGSGEFERRMEDIGRSVREALSRLGPRVEAKGKRIIISGAGVVSSDTPIEEFKCSGSGKVTGDLRATKVRISGACRIEGACESEEFRSSGSAKIGSDLRAREFRSSGSVKIASDLRAAEVTTSGSLAVKGSILDAQEVSASGKLTVGDWVRTQEFSSKGRFNIGRGLEAQEVAIHLTGTSRVPSIKAKEISVRRGRGDGRLRVEEIDGQEIYLESTRAQLVRGESVSIGPFCTIDRVESERLEIHETSTVKEQQRLTDGEDLTT